MSTINPAANSARANGANAAVHAAIRNASEQTDIDFDYLLAQARIESALDPSAKARTSSAAGLYQFTNQTWLATLDKHGAEHGLGWAANAISTSGGRARITDPSMQSAIMQLRYDPQAASLMAGELAGDNAAYLETSFGRAADSTELYLAHFLGAGGARKFIAAHQADPTQSAASLFPAAANANRGVFYTDGRARSVGEVRELFAGKLAQSGSQPDGLAATAQGASPPQWGAPVYADQTGPAQPAPARRPSMTEVLERTFAPASANGTTPAHVSRAYAQIARFGL